MYICLGLDVVFRDVNGWDRIRSDFAFTISYTTFFHRIRSGADNDRLRIRGRIYHIADSGVETERIRGRNNLIGYVRA